MENIYGSEGHFMYDMATLYVRALRVDMQCPLLLSTALGSERGKVIGSDMYLHLHNYLSFGAAAVRGLCLPQSRFC